MVAWHGLTQADAGTTEGASEGIGAAGEVGIVGFPIQEWGRFDGGLVEQTAGVVEPVSLTMGVEPIASHHLTAGFGHVLQIAADKFFDRHTELGGVCLAPIGVVGVGVVAVGHMSVGDCSDLGVAQGAAAHVAGQVGDHPLAMGIAFTQVHVPLFTPEFVEQVVEAPGTLGVR